MSKAREGEEDLQAVEARLEEAARAALAREKHREAPRGDWKDRLWFPSPAERRPCCDAVAPPTLENRQALENHCRSQAHVAHLFGVSLTALRQRVRQLRKSEATPAAAPAGERTVRAFHRTGSSPSDLLYEAGAQGRIDGLREVQQEIPRLQEVLAALLTANADEELLGLLEAAAERNRRLGLALDYALNMERTNQLAQEVRELVAQLYSDSSRKQTA